MLWLADAATKGTKGMQVTKFAFPDGRVLLSYGQRVKAPARALDIPSIRHRRGRRLQTATSTSARPAGQCPQLAHHGVHRDGKFLRPFATYGRGRWANCARHMRSLRRAGHLYIADRGNIRVVSVDSTEKFARRPGSNSGGRRVLRRQDRHAVCDRLRSLGQSGRRQYNPGCSASSASARERTQVMYFALRPPVPPYPKIHPADWHRGRGMARSTAASDDQMDIRILKN